MEQRPLGATGLTVSEIGFGCGNVGGLMVRGAPEERRAAVARALELGITYFDTAPSYGDGLSETHLGQALRELGARPTVGTKVQVRGDDLADVAGAVARSVEASLGRLGLEAVDVLYLHTRVALRRQEGALGVEDVLGPGGVAEALEAQRREGRVRFLGFTALGETVALHRLIESGRFQVLQAYYNLLNPSAGVAVPEGFHGQDFGQLMDRAAAHGMGVVVIRVLAAGALGGLEERHPLAGGPGGALAVGSSYQADVERARALRFLVQEGRQTLAQAAIRFALMKREVSTVLVGYSSRAHLEEAATCSGSGGLPPEALERLRELWRTDFGRAP